MSRYDGYKLKVLEFLAAAAGFVALAATPAPASREAETFPTISTAQKLLAIREATSQAIKSLGIATTDETPKESVVAQWYSWASWASWASWNSWNSWRSWPNF